MIWIWLAGFVSGVVGVLMFSAWFVRKYGREVYGNDKRTSGDKEHLD